MIEEIGFGGAEAVVVVVAVGVGAADGLGAGVVVGIEKTGIPLSNYCGRRTVTLADKTFPRISRPRINDYSLRLYFPTCTLFYDIIAYITPFHILEFQPEYFYVKKETITFQSPTVK